MMSQSNFITPKCFCMGIKVSSSHSCTKITWAVYDIFYDVEYIRFKYRQWNSHHFCIMKNQFPIFFIISWIHNKEFKVKFYLSMLLNFLKKLCHNHRIFSTGNTDCNFITFLNQFIISDCLSEFSPDWFTKFFN